MLRSSGLSTLSTADFPLIGFIVVEYYLGMPLAHPLPEAIVELVAERFRVLGEPFRIRLLECLQNGEASVGELTDVVGTSPQNVSKHLNVLFHAGLVARRKEGTASRYSIADESVFRLCEDVCGSLERRAEAMGDLFASTRPPGT
jgi:DNA-binding transcriptional ArsR family regulator